MIDLLYIDWTFNPRVINSLNTPRWYGLMWGLGFYFGYEILKRIFKKDNSPEEWLDKAFIYVLIGGVLGARFGHCLFYEPEYYLSRPLEILYIWKGGLASHGGAIGVIIASILLNKKVIKKSLLWVLDRLVIPTALAAGLIRLGNLFNHEILGKITEAKFGFRFLRDEGLALSEEKISLPTMAFRMTETKGISNSNYSEKLNDAYQQIIDKPEVYSAFYDAIPVRYPAQLIEALCYFIIFLIIYTLFRKTNSSQLTGFLTGIFFVFVFGARFCIEFIKENQDGIDQNLDVLNMGQYLSIPLVLIGVFLIARKLKDFKISKVGIN